jgi:hypothetical protein
VSRVTGRERTRERRTRRDMCVYSTVLYIHPALLSTAGSESGRDILSSEPTALPPATFIDRHGGARARVGCRVEYVCRVWCAARARARVCVRSIARVAVSFRGCGVGKDRLRASSEEQRTRQTQT